MTPTTFATPDRHIGEYFAITTQPLETLSSIDPKYDVLIPPIKKFINVLLCCNILQVDILKKVNEEVIK
jgi:hypothetical protein